MSKLICWFIQYIVRLWSYIYTYHMNNFVSKAWGELYSLWVRQFIYEVGECSHFGRPLLL